MGDYSSWFRIYNRLNVPLKQKGEKVYSGYWLKWPAKEINGHSTSEWFQLKDKLGTFGSDGEVQYEAHIDGVTHIIQIKVKCPFSAEPNHASIWILSSGDNAPLVTATSIPGDGHPMQAEFVIISRDYN